MKIKTKHCSCIAELVGPSIIIAILFNFEQCVFSFHSASFNLIRSGKMSELSCFSMVIISIIIK